MAGIGQALFIDVKLVATSGGQTAQYLYGLELSGVQQGGQGYSPLADALGSLQRSALARRLQLFAGQTAIEGLKFFVGIIIDNDPPALATGLKFDPRP